MAQGETTAARQGIAAAEKAKASAWGGAISGVTGAIAGGIDSGAFGELSGLVDGGGESTTESSD